MVESVARVRVPIARDTLRRGLVDSHLPLALAAGLVIGGLAFANGGYFPVSWGWVSLALLWIVAIALAFDVASEAGRLERVSPTPRGPSRAVPDPATMVLP